MSKIELSRGCMSNGMYYKDLSFQDMDSDEMKSIFDEVINYLMKNNGMTYYHFIEALVETHGEWESLGTCDQCGDSVEKYTLNMNEDE